MFENICLLNTGLVNLGAQNSITVYSGDEAFTFVNSATYTNAVIRKVGHIVSLHISGAIPNFEQYIGNFVGNIPNPALRPIRSIRVPIACMSGTGTPGLGFAYITNGGEIECIPITGSNLNWIYLDAVYMVA